MVSPALMAVVFPVLVNSLLMSTAFQLYHWYKKGKKLPLGLAFFVFVWMSFEYFHMAVGVYLALAEPRQLLCRLSSADTVV